MRFQVTPAFIDSMLWRICQRRLNPRQFKAIFGPSKFVAGIAFDMMQSEANLRQTSLQLPEYLMCLFWLKNYRREEVCASYFRVTEKTFRVKYKRALVLLSIIKVVDFENRHCRSNFGYVAKVSIDGTDCPIWEPWPFDPKWFSHKFKSAGLRYEVGLCINTGEIVSVFGGYLCGDWPDSGYRGDPRILHKTGDWTTYTARTRSNVRARHETVNSRIKAYAITSTKFRHDLIIHTQCFYSVINLVQIELRYESPLFQIEYEEE